MRDKIYTAEDCRNQQMYANRFGYSDVEPFEVVEVRTDRKLMIRRMSTECIKGAELVALGGFCGHCDNSTQEWKITSDENSTPFAIRLSKNHVKSRGGKVWTSSHGGDFILSDRPRKFYDYNF